MNSVLFIVAALGVALVAFSVSHRAVLADDAQTPDAPDPAPLANGWDDQTLLPDVAANWANEPEPSQITTPWEDIAVAVSPSTYITPGLPAVAMEKNLSAFLDMIAFAEGMKDEPDQGYKTQFGYRHFESYTDHPRQYFTFTNSAGVTQTTSAAGRYQFLARTWDSLKIKLNLQDFSPASQDAACIELIRQRGALNDVKAGRLATAIQKCAPIWASLPGAGYAQPERKLTSLVAVFQSAGGNLEA